MSDNKEEIIYCKLTKTYGDKYICTHYCVHYKNGKCKYMAKDHKVKK